MLGKGLLRKLARSAGYDIVKYAPYDEGGLTSGTIVSWDHQGAYVSFFVVDRGDAIQREHLQRRFYEPEELAIIGGAFRGGCFLDVGANVGNHSIYAAICLGARRVIAIEPNPAAYRTLRVNVGLNGLCDRVRHEAVGLGEIPGRVGFATPEMRNLGATRLLPHPGGTVDVVLGDDLLASEKVDFIKVDVEGMELEVLRGLSKTIRSHRPGMFIEVENGNAGKVAEYLRDMKYEVMERFRRHRTNENILAIPLT